MRGLRFIFLIVVTLGLVLAAGCGGGSATSTLSPAQQKEADLRLAQALVPQDWDFGPGWSPQPYAEKQDACAAKHPGVRLVPTAHVGGVAYQHGDHPMVIGASTVFQTEDQAVVAYRLAVHHNAPCVAGVFERLARQGDVKHHRITAVRYAPSGLPSFGDESMAYHQVIAWNIYGHHMSNQFDLVFFRVGRGVGALLVLDENVPFNQQQLIRLTRAIADRGEAAAQAA